MWTEVPISNIEILSDVLFYFGFFSLKKKKTEKVHIPFNRFDSNELRFGINVFLRFIFSMNFFYTAYDLFQDLTKIA